MVSSLFSAGWRGGLAGLLLMLGAGCQSGRVAFRFAEPAARETAAGAVATPVPADSVVTAFATLRAPQTETPRHLTRVLFARRPAVRQQRPLRQRAALPGALPLAALASHSPTGRAEAQAGKPRLLRRAAQRPAAEAGLGTTVIGLLGIPTLAVGLIGLAFGGGLVFGVLAGAGALALLVAYLDPFG